jgi:hypothetical protein
MAKRNHPASFDVRDKLQGEPKPDLRTDYALIATGVGAALLAFAYLLFT